MNYSVGIIAALASTAKALHCYDSPLRFNLNGDKQKCDWEGVACSGAFDSDKFASHCRGKCNGGSYCCFDSLMKFKTPYDGYKDCKWVGKKEERCDDETVADTCPVACKLCTQPTLQNLESDIYNLKVRDKDLTAEIEILKASLASFCNNLPDHVYIDGVGCFPFVYRDNELKLYVANSLIAPWEIHNEAAIACGGNLASVLDEAENGKIAVYDGRFIVGGMQTQPCDDEPAGCWVWSDGNEIGYSGVNWGEGKQQPNDGQPGGGTGIEDCMVIRPSDEIWNDIQCTTYYQKAMYLLPTNFNSNPNCNITFSEFS